MTQLPDPPWIREAETYGPPEGDDVRCPVCYEENPEFLYIQNFDVIGCSCCIVRRDTFDYARYHPELVLQRR